jgi:localization factor PodJL
VALPPLPQHGAVCDDGLPSPAARAAAMRAKLRQAGLLGDEELDAGELSPRAAAPGKEPDRPFAWWRHRAGLLLGAGLVVFAAGGFFTVDALMTPPERDTSALSHSAQPAGSQAAAPAFAPPPGRGDTTPPDDAPAASSPLDTTMRIAFQPKAAPAPPALEPAAVAPVQAEAEAQAGTAITSLPMTIGPASLRQAAMRGEAAAQLEIAARFAAGAGVPRDMAEAVRWYGRAAAQGLASAQYRLAMLYERGWGTPPDAERARVWYGRAAEQGHVKAMHNLAVLSVGGARSDYATAAKWFAKAADMGLADSQFNLAVLHQTGLGVPKDLRLAYKWLALAARGGDREAATRLAEVKARMAPADVQEAEAQIAVWRARTPDPAVNEPVGLSPVP